MTLGIKEEIEDGMCMMFEGEDQVHEGLGPMDVKEKNVIGAWIEKAHLQMNQTTQ